MKKIIPIFACALLFISCHQNKEGIVKDFIEAENNFNPEKISQLITDRFTCYGTDTLSKEAFLSRLESYKTFEEHASLLNIQDLDSVVKTEEQFRHIIDVSLEITPLISHKRRLIDSRRITN